MKPQVFAYIRWSTDEQTQGDSQRRQVEGAKDYALKHELKLPDTNIIKDPGLSAFTGENVNRGRLGQFLERARQRKIGPGIQPASRVVFDVSISFNLNDSGS
ncbi:MAG TPA: recombinase family protein [Pseudolabrys sp.]|jgi:DNA invertase Pin-like site-specific DNA recombinase|nr:recombinase family protein [Pseudolabrys sp.]